MRRLMLPMLSLAAAAVGVRAQDIVKLPSTAQPSVSRPDDLFKLAPGQWHFARQLWTGPEPCDEKVCEAGFTSGDLVVSVERSDKFVRIIAGLRSCESVGFSELETGSHPGKYTRKKLSGLVKDVVKGVGKTCKIAAPAIAPLDAALMFPAKK